MNSKYTPGPWAVSRDAVPEGHVQNTIYAEGSGERVATAFLAEENASLIAAAPDLLNALEQFLEAEGDPRIMDFEQARAAIARATGR